MYTQVKTPNLDPVIYVDNDWLRSWAGWCLAYAEVAFGTRRLYGSAWEAWQDVKHRHTNRDFPRNVYFPVWFSHFGSYGSPPKYGNWGHVAIAYVKDNGSMTIWSSPASAKAAPDIYHSIEDIERIYRSTYVGWSEDIAQTQVINKTQGDQDMYVLANPISLLKVKLKKPIMMYNVLTGEKLHESGKYLETAHKTTVAAHGTAYYIPTDRAKKGQPYGFKDADVIHKDNDIHDTQHDPKPPLMTPENAEKAAKYEQLEKIFNS